MAHSSLNANLFALFKVNYRKSVIVWKIFKSSSKLDQAEYCKFFRFEMTTKWSWLLCFCQREAINHQNFPRFPLFLSKILKQITKNSWGKKNSENFLQNGAKQKFVTWSVQKLWINKRERYSSKGCVKTLFLAVSKIDIFTSYHCNFQSFWATTFWHHSNDRFFEAL